MTNAEIKVAEKVLSSKKKKNTHFCLSLLAEKTTKTI